MADTESVLLIHDHQAQVLEFDVFLQQAMGADHDVDLALAHFIQQRCLRLRGPEARHRCDTHRPVGEAIHEVLGMLAGQQGRRHQQADLPAIGDGDEGCPHGHLGLAESDITANHAVHGMRDGHVIDDGLNGA